MDKSYALSGLRKRCGCGGSAAIGGKTLIQEAHDDFVHAIGPATNHSARCGFYGKHEKGKLLYTRMKCPPGPEKIGTPDGSRKT